MLGEGPHAPLPETALHPILVRKKSEKLNRSLLVSRIVEISLRSRPFAVPNLDNMIQNSFKHPLGQFSYPHPRCPPFRKMRSGSCCCWSWKHLNRIRLLVYKIRAPAWQSFLLGPSPLRGSQCLLAKDNRNRSQKDHVTVGGWYLMVPPARCRIGFQRLGGKIYRAAFLLSRAKARNCKPGCRMLVASGKVHSIETRTLGKGEGRFRGKLIPRWRRDRGTWELKNGTATGCFLGMKAYGKNIHINLQHCCLSSRLLRARDARWVNHAKCIDLSLS